MQIACDIERPPGYYEAAKVVVVYQDTDGAWRTILPRRSLRDGHRPGEPDLFGGGLERGETHRMGAAREVQEESGIRVDPDALIELTDFGADDLLVTSRFRKAVFLLCLSEPPELVLTGEHTEAMHPSLSEAADVFPHPLYGPALQHVAANLIELTAGQA